MLLNLFKPFSFLFISFLSPIEVFKVFLYSKLNTLIQYLNTVYRIFNFEMYSLTIKIAILVNSAVLVEIIRPALGFVTANILEYIVEEDSIKTSVIINIAFFLFKLF